MDHQEKSVPMLFERRRTLTMTWEGLGDDDDDDRFFESSERLSSAAPINLASSGSDDDENYDDSRMSFASADELHDIELARGGTITNMFGNYNMWMSELGSINERRRRLFQDMGLSSHKNLLSKVVSKKAVFENNPPKLEKKDVSKEVNADKKPLPQVPKQEPLPSKEVTLVRSRSDGNIDACSVNTSTRKEEMLGTVSKGRLTRTLSTLLTPQSSMMEVLQTSNTDNNDAFFVIKDLDSGKEFIVKENRLSEVQTGKQLTMEEFEKSVGYSPVVKELMRRENASRGLEDGGKISVNSYFSKSFRNSKRLSAALLKNIKGVASSFSGSLADREMEQRNNKNMTSKWIKVRQQGKSIKEFTALHLCQEIHAHEGSIWTIKFSPDARYLASAGEDRVVHVWEVQECDVLSANSPDSPSLGDTSPRAELPPMPSERKKKGKASHKKKGNSIPDYVYVPETVFSLSEKPLCSFIGHQEDVLDLSWSKTQQLLSASMDKTVRLWDMETSSCLKLFAHNDYVTCIQFNPLDDNYFISGSLDAKIRIWRVPDRQLVDYTDIHEMVTAVQYTPDGQGALIGSHKGSCRLYDTADCCLEQKQQIELQPKKKKEAKKITGFEFAPGNSSEVLVTSADSRIRIIHGSDVTHKFTGFRNTSSQIAASFSADGKYIVSASEDSQVYIWKREELRNSGTGKSKGNTTISHENFQCKDISVATPWPGGIKHDPPIVEVSSKRHSKRFIQPQNLTVASPPRDELGTNSRRMLSSLTQGSQNIEDGTNSKRHLPPLPKKNDKDGAYDERTSYQDEDDIHEDPSRVSRTDSDTGIGDSFISASSLIRDGDSPSISAMNNNHGGHTVQASAWGMVIVTAGLGGEIRAYQNLGLPVKVGRQTNLFMDLA